MIKSKKDQKGYVLMSSMGLAVLMLLVGGTSIYMVQMGSETNQSERKYQIAKYAADYSLNKAVKAVADSTLSNPCGVVVDDADDTSYTSSEIPLSNSKGTYSYKTQSDESGVNCMIMAYGNYNGARVVKTAIIPVKTDSSDLGSMTTNNVSDLQFSGAGDTMSSTCGAALVYETAGTLAQSDLANTSVTDTIVGSPKVKQQDVGNLFDKVFAGSVDDWDKTKAAIDLIVSNNASSTRSPSNKIVPDRCKFTDTTKDCDTSGTDIVCGTKIIDTTKCGAGVGTPAGTGEIVLSAKNIIIDSDMPSAITLTSNATTKMNITASAKGLLTSDNILNLDLNGTKKVEGILIGNKTEPVTTGANKIDGFNISGNNTLNALYFLADPTATTKIRWNGGSDYAGAIVVNGSTILDRNGGGGSPPDIKYDSSVLTTWGSQYSGFLEEGKCGGAQPPKKAMVEKTEMSLF